jgi:OHS family lactose permease-like MFS transporter
MVGVSFGHSLGLAILSPIAGLGYDRFGFPATYMMIAGFALTFWLVSLFALSPTPPEIGWRKGTDPGPIIPTLEPTGGGDVEPAHGGAR